MRPTTLFKEFADVIPGHHRLAVILPTLIVIALTLVGAALRMHGLFAPGMHADEALFGSWARLIGTWRDPLLSTVSIDKPPLLFYLQAAMYPILASTAPWVARLPNFVASILVIPLTARLSRNIFGDEVAMVVATTIAAFSPLLIQYSASAFTDPLMTALVLSSLVVASAAPPKRRKWQVTAMGLLLGLAIATKYQAILFLPLQLFLASSGRLKRRDWVRWMLALAVPLLVVFIWQMGRGSEIGLWARQMDSFGGLRFAWSWELWPRLEAWAVQWGELLGAPVMAFGLLLFMPLFLALLIQNQDRATAMDQSLLLFLVGYALVHWLLAVPTWDRYLLPVAPLAAVLLGRFVSRVLSFVQPEPAIAGRALTLLVMLAILLTLVPVGVEARTAELAGGGPSGEGASASLVAEALEDAPYGTVLYDHWFSWHWRYYLMDSGVFVSWFPNPETLIEDLNVFMSATSERFIVLPRRAEALVVQRHLREAGYRLNLAARTGHMLLYRVVP